MAGSQPMPLIGRASLVPQGPRRGIHYPETVISPPRARDAEIIRRSEGPRVVLGTTG